MDTKDKVLVQSHDGNQLAIVTCLKFDTLQVQWEKNSSFQLSFTALNNGELDFYLLQSENYIWYEGQQYVIKQYQNSLNGDKNEMQITATHVYYQLNNIRQDEIKVGENSFSLPNAMDWLMRNAKDYSYKIHGNFSGNKKISDFGNCTVGDGISMLLEAFNIYCVYPDNKIIHLYSEAEWVKKTDKLLGYRYNTSTVQLQVDSTSFSNKIWVVSTHVNEDRNKAIETLEKQIKKDNEVLSAKRKANANTRSEITRLKKAKKPTTTLETRSQNEKAEIDSLNTALKDKRERLKKLKQAKKDDNSDPLFSSFYVTDDDSLKKWGASYAERFETPDLNRNDAIKVAKSKLNLNPTLSITLSELSNDLSIKPGESLILQIQEKGLLLPVEVVAISRSPFVAKSTTVTLNNKKQNFLAVQRSNERQVKDAIKAQTNKVVNNNFQIWDLGEINDD